MDSLDLKHILKIYEQCEGVTNLESQEQVLGLVWNFIEDTLRPNMQIFLSKNKRGEHLDEMLNPEVCSWESL